MELSKYEFLQELHYTSQENHEEPVYAKNQTKDLGTMSAGVFAEEKLQAKAKLLLTKIRMLAMSGRFPRIWMARRRRDDKVRESNSLDCGR